MVYIGDSKVRAHYNAFHDLLTGVSDYKKVHRDREYEDPSIHFKMVSKSYKLIFSTL